MTKPDASHKGGFHPHILPLPIYFGVAGGILLIVFGVYTFTRVGYKESEVKELNIKTPAGITYILKGFFLRRYLLVNL